MILFQVRGVAAAPLWPHSLSLARIPARPSSHAYWDPGHYQPTEILVTFAMSAVLDVASGRVAHSLAGHRGGTNGVQFLSGNSLVSVGEDGKARLWNVARASCVHELAVDAEGADRWGWAPAIFPVHAGHSGWCECHRGCGSRLFQ